jgi:hypothetical protein
MIKWEDLRSTLESLGATPEESKELVAGLHRGQWACPVDRMGHICVGLNGFEIHSIPTVPITYDVIKRGE